jgi:hypothetical protein
MGEALFWMAFGAALTAFGIAVGHWSARRG